AGQPVTATTKPVIQVGIMALPRSEQRADTCRSGYGNRAQAAWGSGAAATANPLSDGARRWSTARGGKPDATHRPGGTLTQARAVCRPPPGSDWPQRACNSIAEPGVGPANNKLTN